MEKKRARWLRILGGALAANLLGWAVTVLYAWIFALTKINAPKVHEITAFTLYANLVLVPMAMGIIAAYFWQRLRLRIWDYLWCSFLTVLLCVGGAYLLVKEGAVCLVIASPLLWGAVFSGALMGRLIFRNVDGRLQLMIFPVVLLAIFAEGKIAGETRGVVTDQIVIAAPPAKVWEHVVAFPRITAEPEYWLNKVGLPSAAETTCEGEFVGAKRECIFSNGLVFKEKISELDPQRRLTFDVTEQPNDPELLGHVTLHRGQFELQANRGRLDDADRPQLVHAARSAAVVFRLVDAGHHAGGPSASDAAHPSAVGSAGMIFRFVVRHGRWLSRVPFLPQLFDGVLLMFTALTNRGKLRAIELLERRATESFHADAFAASIRWGGFRRRRTGIGPRAWQWPLRRVRGASESRQRRSQPEWRCRTIIFPRSGWVSFWLESENDVEGAVELLRMSAQAKAGDGDGHIS